MSVDDPVPTAVGRGGARLMRVTLAAVLLTLPCPEVTAAQTSPAQPLPSPPSAAARLQQLIERAARRGPAARSLEARTAARAEELRAIAGLAPPRLELQTEGRDGSFDYRPNGNDRLRWNQPFRWPGSGGGDLRADAEDWQRATSLALRLEEAIRAAGLWLELAAETAAQQVREDRLGRIERALVVYRRRLELGEVAGSEVRQLELERGRDTAALELGRARLEAVRAELGALLDDPPPPAEAGDLEALAAWLDGAGDAGSGENGDDSATEPADSTHTASGPLLDSIELQAELADSRARVQRRTAAGDPGVFVEWERIPEIDGLDDYDALGLQLSVPLPIGGATRARKAQARADALAADLEADLARRQLDQRLIAARGREQAARRTLATLDPLAVELPTTEHSLAEQFRLGAISYLVFLDGFRRADELRLERIGAQLTLTRAHLERALLRGDSSLFPILESPTGPEPVGSTPENEP